MAEFYLINILRKDQPFFIYNKKNLPLDKVDMMQCELTGIGYVLYSISGSNFKMIRLDNGYLVQKKKSYFHDADSCEFSFIEGYNSKAKNASESRQIQRKMQIHINAFDKIFQDFKFSESIPNKQFHEFRKYLATQ